MLTPESIIFLDIPCEGSKSMFVHKQVICKNQEISFMFEYVLLLKLTEHAIIISIF